MAYSIIVAAFVYLMGFPSSSGVKEDGYTCDFDDSTLCSWDASNTYYANWVWSESGINTEIPPRENGNPFIWLHAVDESVQAYRYAYIVSPQLNNLVNLTYWAYITTKTSSNSYTRIGVSYESSCGGVSLLPNGGISNSAWVQVTVPCTDATICNCPGAVSIYGEYDKDFSGEQIAVDGISTEAGVVPTDEPTTGTTGATTPSTGSSDSTTSIDGNGYKCDFDDSSLCSWDSSNTYYANWVWSESDINTEIPPRENGNPFAWLYAVNDAVQAYRYAYIVSPQLNNLVNLTYWAYIRTKTSTNSYTRIGVSYESSCGGVSLLPNGGISNSTWVQVTVPCSDATICNCPGVVSIYGEYDREFSGEQIAVDGISTEGGTAPTGSTTASTATTGGTTGTADFEDVILGNKTYRFQLDSRVNWYQALEGCGQVGMSFAALESEQEARDVLDFLKGYLLGTHNSQINLWVAGRREESSNPFYWIQSGEDIIDSLWQPGQPENEVGNCVAVAAFSDPGVTSGLNNADCSATELPFVCEN